MQTLVGRESELATLRSALERTGSGRAEAVLLLGEPGVGKTRTVQAFSDVAVARGATVLWGRCPEEPGAPPFWPWTQLLRRLSETEEDGTLRDLLGSCGCHIADIWPELKLRLVDMPAAQPLADAGQARFRMFDAVSEFWRRVAARRPTVLILEDLHWADRSSLRLLEFVAAECANARLLFVGTYRDTDVSARHPLLAALTGLGRKSVVHQLRLTGLAREDTARLLAQTAGGAPADALTDFVQEKTDGNPLFVAELARYLMREGVFPRESVAVECAAGRPPWRVPESIRAIIENRSSRLSVEARRLLRDAAVIGRRFGVALLRRLLDDLSDEQFIAALDEALAALIIEAATEAGEYQFGHALIRDALYDGMGALERARIHQRVAVALEDAHRHYPAPYLSLLAHHCYAAIPLASAAKAAGYAARAGEQARARLAYEEAVRYFKLALAALDHCAQIDAELRCRLVVALGDAQLRAGEPAQALEALTDAASAASQRGAVHDLAQAAIGFEEAAWRLGLPGMRAVRLLEEALARVGDDDRTLRSRLQSALVRALVFAGMADRAHELHAQTVDLAGETGDPEAIEAALRSAFWLPWDPAELDRLLGTAHEAMALAQRTGVQERALDAAAFRLHLLIAVGDFHGFAGDLVSFVQLAEALRQPFHQYHARCLRAAQALFLGRFADAERLASEALRLGARLPGLDASGAYGMQMFSLARERGKLLELAPQVGEFVRATPQTATWRPALALVLAELGRFEEAKAELEQLARGKFKALPRDSLWLASVAYLAEVCASVRDPAGAEELYGLLAPWRGRNIVAGSTVLCLGPADRYLGMLCATMRRWDDARSHFAAAIEMNRRQGSAPWLAHAQYHYATMLLDRGKRRDREPARALLEDARRLAAELGMVALEERAARCAAGCGARSQPPALPAGLSRREAQVLRLIATGKSNQEIAATLFRSPNTVANHVRSILAKLGAANRTEAAALAARDGII